MLQGAKQASGAGVVTKQTAVLTWMEQAAGMRAEEACVVVLCERADGMPAAGPAVKGSSEYENEDGFSCQLV